MLCTNGLVPCRRIIFSTFSRCMSFHTGWVAPRIHGELLKLGINVGQTTFGKYMAMSKGATVARLEDISLQSCRRHRVDGFVRGANDLVSVAQVF
jgi:hypothetical protein